MTFEQHLEIADRSIEVGDFAEAKAHYAYARRTASYDWRVWWGLARSITRNFTQHTSENWYKFVDKALMLCKDEESISMMKEKIQEYSKNSLAIIENRRKNREIQRNSVSGDAGDLTWLWIVLGVIVLIIIIAAI